MANIKCEGAVKHRTPLFLEDFKLTSEDVYECERWMSNFATIGDRVTRPEFTEELLKKLIKYEMVSRRRKKYLNRLFGRYSKLRRDRQWREILKSVQEYSDCIIRR
jgi:hypothetical protein